MSIPQKSRQYLLPAGREGYKSLTITEAEVPKLKANDVLVKVHAASLQYRDLAIANEFYGGLNGREIVPGSDMSGEVIAVGQDVTDRKAGDRVCANFSPAHLYGDPTAATMDAALGAVAPGVLTEYRSFPSESLVRIPAHFSYQQASTLPCAAFTAYNALNGRGNPIKAGDTVLVLGTGGVSIWALQLAVTSGATVITTSSSDEKLKIAEKTEKLGAKHLINYRNTPDWEEEVLKITNGVGVDHVVEVGGQGTMYKSIKSVRFGGGVYVIGILTHGDIPQDIFRLILDRAAEVRGILIGSVAQFKDMVKPIEVSPEKTTPVIDKVFAFEDGVAAFAHLESQHQEKARRVRSVGTVMGTAIRGANTATVGHGSKWFATVPRLCSRSTRPRPASDRSFHHTAPSSLRL
ncbi:zinc-binding alcohol dehydrogenase [Ephemerocybe angulata]|uniref:Zinc-binding alcohol dehydrogenase n=1 Tax=Ephemerocybe angulata TaxID=980116 RepID=A0A8H6HUB7_9AGAR|nr:zinc-binding alcohol dehydrogenase [Tulosesus angulatus]